VSSPRLIAAKMRGMDVFMKNSAILRFVSSDGWDFICHATSTTDFLYFFFKKNNVIHADIG
jgi:hypothetical protein